MDRLSSNDEKILIASLLIDHGVVGLGWSLLQSENCCHIDHRDDDNSRWNSDNELMMVAVVAMTMAAVAM